MTARPRGRVLWRPTADTIAAAKLTRFLRWLSDERGLSFDDYHELWRWSVDDVNAFWGAVWDYFEIESASPRGDALARSAMPGAVWFPGVQINYAQRALARRDGRVAINAVSESRPPRRVTYAELHAQTAALAAGLRSIGVRRGDRVAALMPNTPDTVVAMLATASIGAIWSACSPEFGSSSVIERFRQIEPKVLIGADGYRYGGRDYDKLPALAELQRSLPTLERTIVAPCMRPAPDLSGLDRAVSWEDALVHGAPIEFEPVPFDHPLWTLYSSGTTGPPKPITHGHGGILLEHLKTLTFHMDLGADDRFFWFTTTGWMMWNFLVGGLLLGCEIQLFDGDPTHPTLDRLWEFAQDERTTYFGASAPYIHACMKADVRPNGALDLSAIRGLGSTGAPLSHEGFAWVYENVNPRLLLGSFSGGTDVCTGFVGPSPLLPLREGEIQCRCLGAKVEAFNARGESVVNEVGELTLTKPFISMPLFLWGDADGSRMRESYYSTFPGVWRHGDWIEITDRGSCIISGRSDSTLNRGGVRIGTSEFYRVVERMPEIEDSLVLDVGATPETSGRLLLFVVTAEGVDLDDELKGKIAARLRSELSPRCVPDETRAIQQTPRTLNGKKVETPVKRILSGARPEDALSLDALSNPDSLRPFVEMGAQAAAQRQAP